jgi:hypothetical protein
MKYSMFLAIITLMIDRPFKAQDTIMNAVSSSTVTLTLTVEIPVEKLDRAVQALFEQSGSHAPDNFMYYLIHGGKQMSKKDGPFFEPVMKAVETVRPGAIADYRRECEVYKKAPWILHCYAKLRTCNEPLPDGRIVMAELHFPRTPEGRMKAGGCTAKDVAQMQFPLDAVEFADTYADLHAEVTEIQARQLAGTDNANFYRKQADETALMAKLIRASATSPVEKAQMIVTMQDGQVVKTEYLPVME